MKASRPRSPGHRLWTVRRAPCKPESAILSVNSGILDLSGIRFTRDRLVGDIPKVLIWINFVYLADFELVIVNLER